MSQVPAFIKDAGTMIRTVVEVDDGQPPLRIEEADGHVFVLTDWVAQFDGPSIPVYEEELS